MPGGLLPRADSELTILRVAQNSGCEYEWQHHRRLAQLVGLSPEEVERTRLGPGAPGCGRPPRLGRLLERAARMRQRRTEVMPGAGKDRSRG